MTEYISKQRAKDLMGCCLASAKANYKDETSVFKKEQFKHYAETIEAMIDVVGAVEAADVQPVDKWISVDDRLPNIDERVFVYIPRPDNHYNTEIAYISEGNDDYPYWVLRDKSQFYSTRFHYISHWMPLPEPPKEGDTE